VSASPRYALAIIRYLRPLEEIVAQQEAHRAYLRGLEADGVLLASGPFEPRHGGGLLLRVREGDPLAALERLRDGDPFTRLGLARYELLPWNPVIGRERLDRL
jgi:uncharacterized protein YciI